MAWRGVMVCFVICTRMGVFCVDMEMRFLESGCV